MKSNKSFKSKKRAAKKVVAKKASTKRGSSKKVSPEKPPEKMPRIRQTPKEEEARKWAALESTAVAAFNFWKGFLDLKWGANNDQALTPGAERMFLTVIRCISWVESRHGTGSGLEPARDPMQCGNPTDAWWLELNAPAGSTVDRFIRGPAGSPNYDANQLPDAMEGDRTFPADAKLSKLAKKSDGHKDAMFNSKMSYFWGVPILVHKTNTNKDAPAEPGGKKTYKCGDCSKKRMIDGAFHYNGKGNSGYRQNIENTWALIGGPTTARRKSARKR